MRINSIAATEIRDGIEGADYLKLSAGNEGEGDNGGEECNSAVYSSLESGDRAGRLSPMLMTDAKRGSEESNNGSQPILSLTDFPSIEEDGRLAFVTFYVEYPFSIMRHISIPSSDDAWDRKRRILSSMCPILGGQLVVLAIFGWGGFETKAGLGDSLTLGPLVFCASALASFLIFISSNDHTKPRFFPLSVTFAFLMSVVWLDLIANEVVAILEMLGILMNISTSVLGLTVLAWGNSVGDLVADSATAKAGGFRSAVASVYGSPLLSALIGLGLSFTVSISANGDLSSEINRQNTVAVATLVFVLLSSFVTFKVYRWKPPRRFAYFLFATYFVFLVISVALEVL
jgi:sodium/potassium/calcium exchanger 6